MAISVVCDDGDDGDDDDNNDCDDDADADAAADDVGVHATGHQLNCRFPDARATAAGLVAGATTTAP